MKKTFTINLNGIVFHIDDDAYESLQNYLDRIGYHYHGSDEGKEILSDIEARISEILQSKMIDSKQVITLEDIVEIVNIMGKPEDILDQEIPESESFLKAEKVNKRIYRSPDEKILGGICGGIAAYLNIDPVFIRVLFVILLIISAGTGIFAYIILWMIVPEAITTAQKLEMKGEKINVENIEKTIKKEFVGVQENLRKMNKGDRLSGIGRAIETFFRAFGKVFIVLAKTIIIVIGSMLIVGGILLLVAVFSPGDHSNFLMHIHGYNDESLSLNGLLNSITDKNTAFLASAGLILFVGSILFGIIIGIIKLLFNIRTKNRILAGISSLTAFTGLILLIVTGVTIGKSFDQNASLTNIYELNEIISDTLFIEASKDTFEADKFYLKSRDVKIGIYNNENKIVIAPNLDIVKSENTKTELEMETEARGHSYQNARKNASKVIFNWKESGNKLIFSPFYSIQKNEKWRGQEMRISLRIPVGKVVYLDKSLEDILFDVQNTDQMFDAEMTDKFWIMTPNGLELMKKENSSL